MKADEARKIAAEISANACIDLIKIAAHRGEFSLTVRTKNTMNIYVNDAVQAVLKEKGYQVFMDEEGGFVRIFW